MVLLLILHHACSSLSLMVSEKIMEDFRAVSLKVDQKDIFYVNYVVQGYDGLGIVSTKDPVQGLLTITYSEGGREVMFDLIQALKTEGVVKEVIEL